MPATRVYFGGLTRRVRESDIERFFRRYGRLTAISLKNGFAFVEFESNRDARDACKDLNGRDLLGGRVTVELAKGTPHGRDKERWKPESTRGSSRRYFYSQVCLFIRGQVKGAP